MRGQVIRGGDNETEVFDYRFDPVCPFVVVDL
jgi:hypothetical protein